MSLKSQVRFAVVALAFSASSVASAHWAVLAYNPTTGKWGRAQCAKTYQDGLETAINTCGGEGCQRVAYTENGYIALATGDGGWGTGSIHDSQVDADQSSLARCSQHYSNCTVKVEAFAEFCQ